MFFFFLFIDVDTTHFHFSENLHEYLTYIWYTMNYYDVITFFILFFKVGYFLNDNKYVLRKISVWDKLNFSEIYANIDFLAKDYKQHFIILIILNNQELCMLFRYNIYTFESIYLTSFTTSFLFLESE